MSTTIENPLMNLTAPQQKFLSKDQIRELAGSIFTDKPKKGVSEHYTHIPTEQIIDDMATLGWQVVDAKQVRARAKGGVGYQKHLVVFRNPDIKIKGNDVVYPQILLTNSHDGKNAFTFQAGLFRLICSNGLVIATDTFGKVAIRHMGYKFEELQTRIHAMVKELPLTIESLNKMKETELNDKQIKKFAKECLEHRFGEGMKNITIDLEAFVRETRPEDKGNNVWVVYNRIQEKLIHGDFEYRFGAKLRKARKIKNFRQDLDLNKKLFSSALELVAA